MFNFLKYWVSSLVIFAGQKQGKPKDANGDTENLSQDNIQRSSKRDSKRSSGSTSRETTPANEQPAKTFSSAESKTEVTKENVLAKENAGVLSTKKSEQSEPTGDKISPTKATPTSKSNKQSQEANFDPSVPLTPLIVNDLENNHIPLPQATSTPATANGVVDGNSPPLSKFFFKLHDFSIIFCLSYCRMQCFIGRVLSTFLIFGLLLQVFC